MSSPFQAAEYRELRTELSTRKLVYNDANERATDLSAELARVTDDLERVKVSLWFFMLADEVTGNITCILYPGTNR